MATKKSVQEEAPPAEEYRVLALKYRPQTFANMIGQTHVVRQLQGEIRDNRVGHAYLFTGPRGVGKTSMARIFAKALNCVEGPTPSPCGKCTHCLGIANDSDLDVVEVDAATYTKKEETIELLEGIDRAAFNSRYKAYIIDEVHMFSTHSFNVLLKRLEEPPPRVVFILATTNPEKIPETVLSRCRRLEFDRMDATDIVGRLREITEREKVQFPDGEREKVLEAIALASEGGMRDAQVALDQLISLSENNVSLETARQLLGFVEGDLLLDLLRAIVERNTIEALTIVQRLVDKGRDLHRFIKTFTTFLRDGMLLKANAPAELLKVSRANPDSLRKLIDGTSMPMLLNMMQQFLDLEERMRGAAPARFLLEFTLMKLTAIHPKFVLDSMDATTLKNTPTTAGGGSATATAGTSPAKTARIVPVEVPEEDENAPQAMVMREPAATAAPRIIVVEDAPPFPPTSQALKAFIARVDQQFPSFGHILSDATISFPAEGQMQIVLSHRDAAMRGTFQRPDVNRGLREASAECLGRELSAMISVAPVMPREEIVPDDGGEELPAPPAPAHRAPQPAPAATTVQWEENGNAATRNLSFREALDRFPDLREAVDLVKRFCGADPVLFNGQRIN